MTDFTDLTDEQANDLLAALSGEGFTRPYMARIADHPDLDDLQQADREAERQNRDALRAALRRAVTSPCRTSITRPSDPSGGPP